MLNELNGELEAAGQALLTETTMESGSAIARATKPDEFFSLNANYYIDRDNDASDLALDADCILEGVIATIECLTDGLSDKDSAMSAHAATQVPPMLYNLRYQLQMVKSLVSALSSAQFPSEAKA